MGSPFPSTSSSIPDERQGYSPRDFGMVPHTPHIIGHRMSLDQNVPQTPETAMIPTNPTHTTGGLSPTPCYATEAYNHYTAQTPKQDSPRIVPDQQVPATPQGGFLQPPPQTPSTANHSHLQSPSPSQPSQEATTTHDARTAMYTPIQSDLVGRFRSHTRSNSRRHAHTRQTPSLSSRRRLTLDPCLEYDSQDVQHTQLVQQIATTVTSCPSQTTSPNQSRSTTDCFPNQGYIICSNTQNTQRTNFEFTQAGKVSATSEEIDNGEDDDDCLPESKYNIERSLSQTASSVASSVVNQDPSNPVINDVSVRTTSSAMCSHPQPTQRYSHMNTVSGAVVLFDDVPHDPCQAETDKKAEIQKRVRRVMDNSSSHSTCVSTTPQDTVSMETQEDQTSVLDLFADDDLIFG